LVEGFKTDPAAGQEFMAEAAKLKGQGHEKINERAEELAAEAQMEEAQEMQAAAPQVAMQPGEDPIAYHQRMGQIFDQVRGALMTPDRLREIMGPFMDGGESNAEKRLEKQFVSEDAPQASEVAGWFRGSDGKTHAAPAQGVRPEAAREMMDNPVIVPQGVTDVTQNVLAQLVKKDLQKKGLWNNMGKPIPTIKKPAPPVADQGTPAAGTSNKSAANAESDTGGSPLLAGKSPADFANAMFLHTAGFQ